MEQMLKKCQGCANCRASFSRVGEDSLFDEMYDKVLIILNQTMVTNCYRFRISECLKEAVKANIIDHQWSQCVEHTEDLYSGTITLIVNKFIIDWCSEINNGLSGKTDALKNSNFMFLKAWRKYQKTLKNVTVMNRIKINIC